MTAEKLKQGATLGDWARLRTTLRLMEAQLVQVARRVRDGQATDEALRQAELAVSRTRELSDLVLARALSNLGRGTAGTRAAHYSPGEASSERAHPTRLHPGPEAPDGESHRSRVESRNTRTVLVVDDNPSHCYAVARVLSRAGFRVAEAWHGQAALDAAPAADAVVLDIFMPDMDGWQVCRRLRANPLTESMPILFFSAAHGEEVRQECERAGGNGYYPAPVPPDELVRTLGSLMGIGE